jgi:hypothetical protein
MNTRITNNTTATATIAAKVEMRESRYGNPQPTLALEISIARWGYPVRSVSRVMSG